MKLFEKTTLASCVSQVTCHWSSRHDVAWNNSVRVEIHSLDNPPWPTERPEGWGVGWWCRFMDTRECGRKVELQGIVYNKYISLPGVAYQVVLPVPVDGPQLRNVGVESITAFGPRAEVPG